MSSIISSQQCFVDLIVISNDCDEQTLRLIEQSCVGANVDLHIIINDVNKGVAYANNQGVEKAKEIKSDILIFSNNDITFDHLCIYNLIITLHRGCDAVSPLITYFDEPEKIWYDGGRISYLTGRTIHLNNNKKIENQNPSIFRCSYAPTCFLVMWTSVFDSVGAFDEKYFVYYDDSDFIHRFNQKGLQLYCDENAIVKHKVSSSTGGALSDFTIYYSIRNRLWFIRKNFHTLTKITSLSCMFITTAIKILIYPEYRRKNVLRAIIIGIMS